MSSTSQISSETPILASIGKDLLDQIVGIVTFTLIYGVFVVLFFQLTTTLLKRQVVCGAYRWMFLACTFNFILATVREGSSLARLGITIYSEVLRYEATSLMEKPSMTIDLISTTVIILTWANFIAPIVSDSIVVWRVFVLLQHRRGLVLIPSVLLMGSAVSALVYLIYAALGADIYNGFINNLAGASLALSLATNTAATAIIGYIYWCHRKVMKEGFSGGRRLTRGERALAKLVESGILLCLPQAVYFFLGFLPNTAERDLTAGHYAKVVFTSAYFALAAMYPILVLVLVNNQRTLDQLYVVDDSMLASQRAHATTLRFAPPELATSSDSGILPWRVGRKEGS